jgi:Predicted membrane protein (DUF2254)
VHEAGLVRWARRHDCVLVQLHPAGDFVAGGSVLLEVYGDVSDARLGEPQLRDMVALGVERTIEQDPAFALRILVDIAIRALSPAPIRTTAYRTAVALWTTQPSAASGIVASARSSASPASSCAVVASDVSVSAGRVLSMTEAAYAACRASSSPE